MSIKFALHGSMGEVEGHKQGAHEELGRAGFKLSGTGTVKEGDQTGTKQSYTHSDGRTASITHFTPSRNNNQHVVTIEQNRTFRPIEQNRKK